MKPKTVFIDIDGTLLRHMGDSDHMMTPRTEAIAGTIPKLREWHEKGYCIIITTSRPEGLRDLTTKQLTAVGIFFDKLIMGLPRGPRVVINDTKPDGTITALGYSLPRDEGIKDICI